jgi:hypothetical protein
VLTVVDHTEPSWASRYAAKGRENGAATYSRDIVRWHVPVWERLLPEGSVVSTCPLLTSGDWSSPVVVQYLHSYQYVDPLGPAWEVVGHLGALAGRIVFVTAYRSLAARLRLAGMEALHVPMAIDADAVRASVGDVGERYDGRRVVYFGNVTRHKRALFAELRRVFERRGWRFDVVSESRFDGQPVTQAEAWRILARYRYGIGVGRCALEMMALGLRVMVAGAEFGGLITTEDEWRTQWATNLNGRVVTFDRDVGACVDAFEHAMLVEPPGPGVAELAIEQGWATAHRD